MPITSGIGGTVITGESIGLFRLLALRQALKMHIRSGGQMQMTRGPKATTRVKAEFGWKGGPEKLLAQLNDHISFIELQLWGKGEIERLTDEAAEYLAALELLSIKKNGARK